MKIEIGRLGDVHALVLPAEIVEQFGLREGQEIDSAAVEAMLEADRERREHERREALERIRETAWPPLPNDWKFDRDEANAR